jgi:hypothetical protein
MKVTYKLNPENACYYSVQRLLTEDGNINSYRIKVLCYCVQVRNFVCHIKRTTKLKALQNTAMKRILETKGQKFPGGWGIT